jgi:hypothetical protein
MLGQPYYNNFVFFASMLEFYPATRGAVIEDQHRWSMATILLPTHFEDRDEWRGCSRRKRRRDEVISAVQSSEIGMARTRGRLAIGRSGTVNCDCRFEIVSKRRDRNSMLGMIYWVGQPSSA